MVRLRTAAFSLLVVVLCTTLAQSSAQQSGHEVLTPAARLRKLSLSLVGSLPTYQEYSEVNALTSDQVEDYLARKTHAYIDSKKFSSKFFERVMDALRFNENTDISTI